MDTLEKYVNRCFLERTKEYIFVYKIVKEGKKYGLIGHEAQLKPAEVWVYKDISEDDEIMENGLTFIESFVPEINPACSAESITEEKYYELISKIEKMFELQETLFGQIKNYVRSYGLDEKV